MDTEPADDSPEPSTKRPGRTRRRVIVGAVVLAALVALCAPVLASTGPSARDAALDKAIARIMDEQSIPGAIVGVWQQGEAPYVKAFGASDAATHQPMSTDLHTRIGSVTKTFTVTAVLQLVDQGKVGLDDPISKYVAGVPDGDTITLRELAEMRSGLFDYLHNPAFTEKLLADPKQQWTPEQLLAYSFDQPMTSAPGTQYAYVNTNTVLLGLVVEQVAHQAIGDYILQHITEPLHLAQTSLPNGSKFPSPYAHGHTITADDCELNVADCDNVVDSSTWNFSWAGAAGGMVSTLDDMHRWAPALATGALLSPGTQKQRLHTLPTDLKDYEYGLGVMKLCGWIGHSGIVPGYQSLVVYLPSERATLVILINSGPGVGHPPVLLLGHAISAIVTPKNVIIEG